MRSVDGYVRVSRVAGRNGESFISPDEQRREIERYASAHKLHIAAWHEDLDQSGGTLDRPAFQEALGRCRRGETGGIIAAKLDRLSRSTVGLGTLVKEAREGGWNLIAVDFGLDLFSVNGKLVASVLASVAEWELDRHTGNWQAARRNFIERGVPNGRAPVGYCKRPDGRLEVVEEEAVLVREAFRQRANGVSYTAIGQPNGWSLSTTRHIVSNETYLGIVRAGEFLNDRAHPAIVTREEFDAAQAAQTVRPARTGAMTSGCLLIGLARCAGCGRTLKVVRKSRKHPNNYYCKDAATERCPSRAFVPADELDHYVEEWFAGTLENVPRMIDVVAAGRDLETAQSDLALAESELIAYVEAATGIDPALWRRGFDAHQGRVDEAHERVQQLSARLTRLPAGGSLSALWDTFTVAERREVLAGFIGRVEVDRGASAELASHVRIFWTDGTLATDESRVRKAAA